MINVLLDPLPETFEGYPINTDFRIGIQIDQALKDESLSPQERMEVAADLLFGSDDGRVFPDVETCSRGITWFMSGWYTDRQLQKDKTDKKKAYDYDADQWRIFAAFLAQYRIDLSREDTVMHFWSFMGLLTSLGESAFTRVIDLRTGKPPGKLGSAEQKAWKEQQKRYSLENEEQQETEAEKEERERRTQEFLAMTTIHRAEQ